MIDLHTHTTESDGTLSPSELIQAAVDARLDAIAITDHDTFAGFEKAVPFAKAAGLPVYRGIELSTALGHPKERAIHLLGYFFKEEPSADFVRWLEGMQAARRDRNIRLAARLQSLGFDIKVEEVYTMGRSLAGRPHFARLMVQKGYATSTQDAFERYLGESAAAYVEREEPDVADAIRRVNESGGISSLAHPIRLGKRDPEQEEQLIARLRDEGLQAIEVFHSDHTATDQARYGAIARKYGFRVTGGSDFHGANKPNVRLGTGNHNNISVSKSLLEGLLQ